MDWIFVYLFAVWSVIFLTPNYIGVEGNSLPVGLAVRSGEPSSVIAQKNGELLLNCSVAHDAEVGELILNWTKDGSPVELERRVRILQNGSLYIKRILHRPRKERSDAGWYRCIATLINGGSVIGRVIIRDINVQVSGIGRKFDIEPQPQTVPVGGAARFQCQIPAVPPASYMWERNKTSLPQNDNRYLELKTSGILQITGVGEDDVGQYRCYATQGKLYEVPGDDIEVKYSEEAALNVSKGSEVSQTKIVASSRNVTAIVQSTALLECLVEGYHDKVQWRHNDKRVPAVNSSRLELVGNNLRIVETELSDDGKYECSAGNIKTVMTLNIIKKPVIIDITASKRYPRAQWIYLDCKAEGPPKPQITWLKDGEDIDFGGKFNYQKHKENQLAIVISRPSNSGFYQCVASNEAGNATAFTRVEVFERDGVPKMPTHLKAVQVTSTSILVTWTPAEEQVGYPVVAYSVHYRKDGLKGEETVVTGNDYLLSELSPFSDYIIYVAAYSSTGQGPFSEQLVVRTREDLPSQPPSVTLEPRDSSVLVKWQPLRESVRNGIIKEYKIYWREKGVDAVQVKIVDGNATSFLVTGLDKETDYEFRMLAATSVGYRETFTVEQWPWVEVKTLSDSYLVPPDVTLTPLNRTSISVTWDFVARQTVKSFQVTLKLIPANQVVKTEQLAATASSFLFTQLDENAVYEVTVVAETISGERAEATEEFSFANVRKVPGPENLRVTLTDVDYINVEWDQPYSSIEVVSFTVRYRPVSSSSYQTLTSETNSLLLEDLQPDTSYEIAVRANAEKLLSLYSAPLYSSTSSGVPSAPQSVQIKILKPGSVSIDWQPPARPNGNIKSYTILYTTTPSNSDDLWIKVEKNGSENSAQITITDMSGAVYYFKLHANTEKGPGPSTEPFTVKPATQSEGDPLMSSMKSDQTLGIVIGVSIGVFFIIACTIIVICLYRCYGSNRPQEIHSVPARYNGNGHIPGNGNGHAVQVTDGQQTMAGVYEMEAYTPMLHDLPENEHSDSKGGGDSNVILTPNGAKLNGFISFKQNGMKNGQITNGHPPLNSYLHTRYNGSSDPEETRELIAAMLAGSHDQCMTAEESFTRSRFEDLGSLDNIDTGSSDDGPYKGMGKKSEGQNSGEDSGEGSWTASEHASSASNSVHQLERTDTGDTAVFCGGSVRGSMMTCLQNTGVGEGSGRADLPVNIPQTSHTCEDTISDGGTRSPPPSALVFQESVSGLILPQGVNTPRTVVASHVTSCTPYSPATIATSAHISQALRLTDNIASGESDFGVQNEHAENLPQDLNNGSPAHVDSHRRRHPATSNGIPPQLYVSGVRHPERNGVLPRAANHTSVNRRPQGYSNGLSFAENNPSWMTHEGGILVDSSNGHVAQLPQESVARSASVEKTPPGHIHV